MIKNEIKEYIKKQATGTTKFNFQKTNNSDETENLNIKVSAVLSFVILGDELVIIKNKNKEWDIPGGKIEKGESWKNAVIREIKEEAGVVIKENSMELLGYFLAENSDDNEDTTFPKKSLMPLYLSYTDEVISLWKKQETLDRKLVKFKELEDYFKARDDNGQLLNISKYVKRHIKNKNIQVEFEYLQKENINSDKESVVTLQAMAMCQREDEYCVVKDFDEEFFSIPGGGCELGESSLDCIKREISEEAQFNCEDYELLGRLFVSFYDGERLLSRISHDRYLCKINEDSIKEFIPRKDGFEIDERKFLKLDDIQNQVKILQNSTGDEILKDLKNK